jgi:5'-nucleotidase
MMRWIWTMALTGSLALGAGCENGNEQEMGQAPPAEADQPEPLALEEAEASDEQAPVPAGQEMDGQDQENEPERMEMPPEENGNQGPNTYTVQEGDTLWSIAEEHYGDGQRWEDIVEANPGLAPENLAVGQEITLPE